MVQRVAMHVIRLTLEAGKRATDKTAAVAPKSQDIQPGTLFEVPADKLEAWERDGSVVKTTDKRAGKFGFGSIAAEQAGVEAEDGETEASASRRRRNTTAAAARAARQAPAKGAAKRGKGKDDLVG